MGKYTSLARQLRDEEHNKEVLDNKSVKINSIDVDSDGSPTGRPHNGDTPLRPYAVNAVIQCIHGISPSVCGVCSGYARWLAGDADRLRRAQTQPEEVRREFWRLMKGSARDESRAT
jgi:hypothetical protein